MVGIVNKTKKKTAQCRNANQDAAYTACRKILKREKQLEAAVKWCREHGKRGFSAISSGMFPLVKSEKTINKRLDGKIKTGREKEYCSILTADEESDLVRHLGNKNRCFQALNKKEVTALVFSILEYRQTCRKTFKYRRVTPLSNNAKRALQKRKLSQTFWTRFMAKHKHIIKLKRQGSINIKRAVNCTRQMAESHIDELAQELISAGIFTNSKKIHPGKWTGHIDMSRVFNHDETPQMINYGVDGTASGKVFGSTGESCQRLTKENRECPTIHPMVSCSGDKVMCQVIFSRRGIDSNMLSDKIPNLVVSTTQKGVQDHKSLLKFYQQFDEYLVQNKIQKPVVVLSDGHSSRFESKVFHFLCDKDIRLFISPPDTTSVTQLLDQVNKSLHEAYRNRKKELYSLSDRIGIKEFMTVLSDIWPNWVTSASLVKAAKRVGITESGLDVEYMQTEKFEQAELLQTCDANTSLNSSVLSDRSNKSLVQSPAKCRSGSKEYWKAKCQNAEDIINKLVNEHISLDEVPSLFQYQQVTKQTITSTKKKVRVTQMHGSMCNEEALAIVDNLEKEKASKEKAAADKKQQRIELSEAFFRCKTSCVCVRMLLVK